MNDPNGLVYLQGVYHLFHQHNPNANQWGNIHWGHARSLDLVHWEHRRHALYPDIDGLGIVASGCVVIDSENTAGFGSGSTPVMVAVFTHISADGRQVQSLAYSLDQGEHWTMYAANPVLVEAELADFRDPKVFWHQPSHRWVMALAAGDHIRLYISTDLKQWQHTQSFGGGVGAHDGVWECPDLIEMTFDDQTKWVLLVSVQDGAPNGGSGTQYFIGDFDGRTFVPDALPYPLWFDYGPDNYAAVSWSGAPQTDPVVLGWMSNWRYADQVPTSVWRGAMTVPRRLSLRAIAGQPRLTNRPVPALDRLRETIVANLDLGRALTFPRQTLDVELSLRDDTAATECAAMVFRSDSDDELRIARSADTVVIDRRRAVGNTELLAQEVRMTVPATGRPHRLRVLLDQCSVEVFADDGVASATALIFPQAPLNQVAFNLGDGVRASVRAYMLRSAWAADDDR